MIKRRYECETLLFTLVLNLKLGFIIWNINKDNNHTKFPIYLHMILGIVTGVSIIMLHISFQATNATPWVWLPIGEQNIPLSISLLVFLF